MASTSKQLQIRLSTPLEEVAVAGEVLSVPASIDPDGLNQLVRGLLREAKAGTDEEDEDGIGKRR